MAFYSLFIGQPENAVSFSQKGIALAPDLDWLPTNLATGYLLTDEWEKAKVIYDNLKDGGKFIGINSNPDQPLTSTKKYGTKVAHVGPLTEGSKLAVTIYNGEKELCSFTNYHWSKETYEEAFKKAGFKKFNWVPLEVSQEGIDKYDKDFWEAALEDGNIVLIELVK